MDLPRSDGCSVKAYPAQTAEAFCDGHVAAFDFFGGVPPLILYDKTRLAVAKIVKGGRRLRSHMFAELQRHYLFDVRFDAVKQIVLARIEKRPPRLNPAAYPSLPRTCVGTTSATGYAMLVSGSAA